MKPDRWQQVDNLFHSALERTAPERTKFLEQACAGDDELREEVEALLSAHEQAGSFIERPAVEIEARSLINAQGGSMIGKTIGHYRLVALLGTGGMGEVYLAEDALLGRKVALKLLPAAFTTDTERLRRFEQEARAASGLNHPNIVTIHEIGQDGDLHFIAQEFVEGATLSTYLGNRPLTLNETLEVTMQVASALASAHAKGIVHRDIKPENIMVHGRSHLGRQNHVKVLDFGIAKLADVPGIEKITEATTRILLRTEQGLTIGTAAYMSPEQARGDSVDARTDIWSLGVVLYEMLTGKKPYVGDTSQDVIASILRDDSPPLPSESPEGLKWILRAALRKDREERYQTMRELFSDLQDLHEQLHTTVRPSVRAVDEIAPSGSLSTEKHQQQIVTKETGSLTSITRDNTGGFKHVGWRGVVALTALVVVVAGIAFGLYKLFGQKLKPTQNQASVTFPFQRMKMARLTASGKVAAAAISPDGKYVVHVIDDGEQQSLWMRQILTSSNVQIKPPADITYLGITFSPDGNYLYYIAWDKERNNPFTLFQMSPLGGTSRKLIQDIDSNVTFSPDQKQFAFVRGYPTKGTVSLFVANADGTAERAIATRPIAPNNFGDPAWSPDGKVIAYPAETADANGWVIEQVQVSDGSVKAIGPQRWWEPNYLKWLPNGLMFSARESIEGPSQIWYLSYPGGEAHRITNDLNDYIGVSLSSDSAVLITVQCEQVSNLWLAPENNARRARQITSSKFDGAQGISWTPAGKIVYASGASGRWDLWMVDSNGVGQKQLTSDSGNNFSPSVSPDGRYIVFISDRKGSNHVWRIDIDGSNARQLTFNPGARTPECLRGDEVLYTVGGRVWKVPIDGGEPVQIIAKDPGKVLTISPDDKWIAIQEFEPTAIRIAVYPIEGGESHNIVDLLSLYCRWTPDGSALACLDEKNISHISSQPMNGGPPKELIEFKPDQIFSFAWSVDGKQLAVSRGSVNKDVLVLNDFKEPR